MKAGTLENGGEVKRDRENIRKLEMRGNGAEGSLQAHLTQGKSGGGVPCQGKELRIPGSKKWVRRRRT